MRPYLAILSDAFSEAAQSRVLWILLLVWTIILAAIAPFSLIQGTTLEIQADQILARSALTDALTEASEGRGTEAQRAVWKNIDPTFQQKIIDRQRNQRGGRLPMGELAEGLNSVLKLPELYDATAWPNATERSGLRELVAKGVNELTPEELQNRNRRLIEMAFPGTIRSGERESIWIGYAGFKVSDPLPLTRKQVIPFFEGVILMTILKIGLGVVGVFVGIIVTSPMVPEMFQVGSLHLLLSKPISRIGLLLTKFLGGTGFVFLNVSYLLVGFFLLVGWRLAIWNVGILWCIPIFVFVFMIYYSVSMLVGLIWRNAIISIALTGLFWLFCTTIGITHGVMQGIVTIRPEIVHLFPMKGALFSVSQRGKLHLWDTANRTWQVAYGDAFEEEAIIGPFWLPEEKALYLGRPYRLPLGGQQTDGIRLQTVQLPELAAAETKESTPAETEMSQPELPLWSNKRVDTAPELPPRTRRAVAWRDTIAILTERGLYGLDRTAGRAHDAKEPIELFGIKIPLPQTRPTAIYPKLSPEEWQPESPMDLCFAEQRDQFIVYTRGDLVRLRPTTDGDEASLERIPLDLPEGTLALVACNHERTLIATNRAGLLSLAHDSDASQTVPESQAIIPRQVAVSPADGTFLVLDRERILWRVSADGRSLQRAESSLQGSISAIHIDPSGDWWLAHDVNQVTVWRPLKNQVIARFVPTLSLVDRIYYWAIYPLYWLNPKPAAVDVAIQRSLTQDHPLSLGRETTELQGLPMSREDLWQPIWSNTLFICIMLAIGSRYMYRQDL